MVEEAHLELVLHLEDHGVGSDGLDGDDLALVGALEDDYTVSGGKAEVLGAAGPGAAGFLLGGGELGVEESSVDRDGAVWVAEFVELASVTVGGDGAQLEVLVAADDGLSHVLADFFSVPLDLPHPLLLLLLVPALGLALDSFCHLALGHGNPAEDLVHLGPQTVN